MKQYLIKRRRDLLSLRSKGFTLSECVKTIALQHKVTDRCVYTDWQRRNVWMPEVIGVENTNAFFLEIISNHIELRRLVVLEYAKADNSNAKIGALRLYRDVNVDLLNMKVGCDFMERLENVEIKQ